MKPGATSSNMHMRILGMGGDNKHRRERKVETYVRAFKVVG